MELTLRGPTELLALMHFLHPDRYSLDMNFDLEDEHKEAKIADLHQQLESIMLRRLKKDVIKELPTKSERILRVEMSKMQHWWYTNIVGKVRVRDGVTREAGPDLMPPPPQNYEILNSESNQVSLLNVAMELKKASNHPYLFDGAEERTDDREAQLRGLVVNSGKMILLDKLLTRLKNDGHRVLIFSQMVRLLCVRGRRKLARLIQLSRAGTSCPTTAPCAATSTSGSTARSRRSSGASRSPTSMRPTRPISASSSRRAPAASAST